MDDKAVDQAVPKCTTDKKIFYSRCLSAGICLIILLLLVVSACAFKQTEDKELQEAAVCHADRGVQNKSEEQLYCLSQDIGNGTWLLIRAMRGNGQKDTGRIKETLDVEIYHRGEAKPFQKLKTDYFEQDTTPFVFCDLNADGYLDLIFGEKKSSGYSIVTSWLWSTKQQKFVRGPEELDGSDYYAITVDKDSRRIRIGNVKTDSYENFTWQWINETDCELVKAFYETRTEEGAQVQIDSFCDGEQSVWMDCRYDVSQFPYYFDRYSHNGGDIFYEFYADDPVWEKTVHVDKSSKTYTLYYAQNIKYDSEYSETVAGYEGHLWIMDEETRIVKRLFWQSETPYKKIIWEEQMEYQEYFEDAAGTANSAGDPMLFIQYADGSSRTCTLSEIFKDPAKAIFERSMQIDFRIKEYTIHTAKYDAITDKVYKNAYYRAISGQDMVKTSEREEFFLKEEWDDQGDSGSFLQKLINQTKFYYMDFDGDGLPELVMDILGCGFHILKYLPDEGIVEHFFGCERMSYYHLLGAGQLYYNNCTLANKDLWEYDMVDADGSVRLVIHFGEDADYKPHREDSWWDTAYWVYLDEELGMVQVDEKSYQEIFGKFYDAVTHAVTARTFEDVFGEHPKT